MSPDMHLNKNSKAMAQLAPLEHNPAQMNTAILKDGKNGKGK